LEVNVSVFVWVVQTVLAAIFFTSGIAKLVMSKEKMLTTGQTGTASQPLPLIRFVAVCEILGAAGLILPIALRIDQFLTPLAALGLAVIMAGAARIQTKLREPRRVAVNIVLLILCLFIAYGRW
jgi:uncharacterized membrane protein YphA (DoxX/SURF4 family)